jgi:tetratricopeptide (TPR) repeat protein
MKTIRKNGFVFAAWIVFLAAGSASADQGLTELVRKIRPAVAKIVVYDMDHEVSGLGSGFFVNPQGHLVTNFHVLKGAFSAEAIVYDGKKYPIESIVAQDPDSDLIKVSVGIPRVKTRWLDIAGDVPEIAEQVLVVGSPLGLEQSVSEGIVSAVRELPNIGKFFQTTAPISAGSSGSPVLNMNGSVIGIVSFQSVTGQNINFAVSAENVLQLKDDPAGQTLAEWTIGSSGEKPKLAEELCRKGVQFSIEGKYRKALSFYKDAAEKDPNNLTAWYGLSGCYDGLGRTDEAVDTLKKATRIHLWDPSLYYSLGNYYEKSGRYEEAIKAYRDAARIAPDRPEAYDRLGIAYGRIGRYREAIDAHRQVLRINPGSAPSHFQIGAAYTELNLLKEAIDAYEKAISLDPQLGEAYANLGTLYSKAGQPDKGIEAFKQAIRIDPDDAQAHLNIGLAYLASGDVPAAFQEFKILKKLDPQKSDRLFDQIYR